MKTIKLLSAVKASCLAVVFLMISSGLQAQDADVVNNTDCDIEIRFAGIDNNCVPCVHNGGAITTVVGSGGTATVSLFGLTCDITHGISAQVRGVGGAWTTVRTFSCMGSCSGTNILSATMTFPAGVCYAGPTNATVDITCSGTDIDIEVNL